MRNVLNSYGRALLSQLHGKILLLSAVPFILSVILWGVLLYVGLQPLIDSLHALFTEYDFFRTSGQVLATFGLGVLKAVIVPLIAMFMLLPLMILTALIFMGLFAMPAIARHVGGRHFPWLEKNMVAACSAALAPRWPPFCCSSSPGSSCCPCTPSRRPPWWRRRSCGAG